MEVVELETYQNSYYFRVTAGNAAGFSTESLEVSSDTFALEALFESTNNLGCKSVEIDQEQYVRDTSITAGTVSSQIGECFSITHIYLIFCSFDKLSSPHRHRFSLPSNC